MPSYFQFDVRELLYGAVYAASISNENFIKFIPRAWARAPARVHQAGLKMTLRCLFRSLLNFNTQLEFRNSELLLIIRWGSMVEHNKLCKWRSYYFFLIWQLDTRFQVDEILGPTKMDLDLTQSVFKKFRKFIQVSADVYFH